MILNGADLKEWVLKEWDPKEWVLHILHLKAPRSAQEKLGWDNNN